MLVGIVGRDIEFGTPFEELTVFFLLGLTFGKVVADPVVVANIERLTEVAPDREVAHLLFSAEDALHEAA